MKKSPAEIRRERLKRFSETPPAPEKSSAPENRRDTEQAGPIMYRPSTRTSSAMERAAWSGWGVALTALVISVYSGAGAGASLLGFFFAIPLAVASFAVAVSLLIRGNLAGGITLLFGALASVPVGAAIGAAIYAGKLADQ
jgi:hypothetical protein